jgi:hypothetical protein
VGAGGEGVLLAPLTIPTWGCPARRVPVAWIPITRIPVAWISIAGVAVARIAVARIPVAGIAVAGSAGWCSRGWGIARKNTLSGAPHLRDLAANVSKAHDKRNGQHPDQQPVLDQILALVSPHKTAKNSQ